MTELERYQDPLTIQRALHSASTIAIVGLSSNELRASHFVGFYLQRHGYRVIPVNPRETEVLGEPSYASLHGVTTTASALARPSWSTRVPASSTPTGTASRPARAATSPSLGLLGSSSANCFAPGPRERVAHQAKALRVAVGDDDVLRVGDDAADPAKVVR